MFHGTAYQKKPKFGNREVYLAKSSARFHDPLLSVAARDAKALRLPPNAFPRVRLDNHDQWWNTLGDHANSSNLRSAVLELLDEATASSRQYGRAKVWLDKSALAFEQLIDKEAFLDAYELLSIHFPTLAQMVDMEQKGNAMELMPMESVARLVGNKFGPLLKILRNMIMNGNRYDKQLKLGSKASHKDSPNVHFTNTGDLSQYKVLLLVLLIGALREGDGLAGFAQAMTLKLTKHGTNNEGLSVLASNTFGMTQDHTKLMSGIKKAAEGQAKKKKNTKKTTHEDHVQDVLTTLTQVAATKTLILYMVKAEQLKWAVPQKLRKLSQMTSSTLCYKVNRTRVVKAIHCYRNILMAMLNVMCQQFFLKMRTNTLTEVSMHVVVQCYAKNWPNIYSMLNWDDY